ncbi:MAG: putative Xenobiotic-transporting ATPase [Candidatus Saccharibacteria bacterium]|nr:putative Xenobiotic-transporting ATPase [Candidatus Saccharibacteria bacterium]
MQDQRLQKAIEEGVAKGVPVDFIAYSLTRAGWPQQMVKESIDAWMFENGRRQKTTPFTPWLRRYYAQAKPAIILMVVLNTIASAIALLQPWPLKLLADSVFGTIPAPGPLRQYTHTPTLILIVSLLTLLIFLLSQAFGVLKDYFLLKIGFWLNRSIKEESFRHILHLPLYHEGRLPKGDYIYRQNDVTNSLSDLVLNTTSEIIGSVILIIGVTAIMLTLNAQLTIIAIVVIPFLILSVKVFGPIMGKLGQALNKLSSNTAALIAESIDNTEAVQAFTLQERQVQKLKDLWQQTYVISRKGLLWGKLFQFSNGLVVIMGTSLVIYFGGTQALNGQFSLGSLLIFMTYLGYLIGPIQDITSQITIRRQKLVNVRRVYEVLSDHEGVERLREGKPLPRVQGRIRFQNVSYAYRGTNVLDQVSLTIEPGEKVGIIGPSGAGKSTLMRLLDLYIEPTAGRILVDDYDIQTVSLQDLRRNIAWISQSPQLFATSIFENMLDGDISRTMTPDEIVWAAQAANVEEFVTKLPMGMESIAGEGGSSLSGGQRQRISIARALLKNAPIICMDEPTSALDARSEKLIHDSIGSLIKDKTVLLVTHRLPLLSLMDKVFVLQDGHLINVDEFGGVEKYAYQLQINGQL